MIARKPWTYGNAIVERDYLQQGDSFDSLVQELLEALSGIEQSSVTFCIDPKNGKYRDPDLRRLKCKRPSWTISIASQLLDKLFNGQMGIRAQYYKSPDQGASMNRLLLSTLHHRLVELALSSKNCSVADGWIARSLSMPSAKIWISETDLAGRQIIRDSDPTLVEDELQNDWLDVARMIASNQVSPENYNRYFAALQGVRCPIADQLLIQGAWLTQEGLNECVTSDKRDRDCQLFMFGHT